MRLKNAGIFAAVCVCSASLLAGCSFSDVKNKIVGGAKKVEEAATDVNTTSIDPADIKTVDTSIEKPAITKDIPGATSMAMGAQVSLTVEATVSQGNLSYQWYKNNVDSNGGGTKIEGATSSTIQVDTTQKDTCFYYVVITNEVNGKINNSTSSTHKITVMDVGTWQPDGDTGRYRYMLVDGTYPIETWFTEVHDVYYVDDNGYRVTGVITLGEATYYFDEEGRFQTNTVTPDGRTVDENGLVAGTVDEAVQSIVEETAESASGEESAPADAGTEAAAESAPAEGESAETVPAEDAGATQ